ncbi:MAG: carboxypeptidase regulatory-like domain-containing protein [bacterium]|nr:carboxypeptidase regulatory-like domain-containing protein [bacterium]
MRSHYYTLIALVFLFIIGCSGSSPVQPDTGISNNPVASHNTDFQAQTNRYLWADTRVRINEDLTADFIPARTSEMHFNVVKLMENAPCLDCIHFSNIHFTPGNILSVDMTIKHPFPGDDRFTAFDCRGVFVTDSDYNFPDSGRTMAYGDSLPVLQNPDGYTALFNPTEFPYGSMPFPMLGYIPGKFALPAELTATLNPYVAFNKEAPRRILYSAEADTRTLLIHIVTLPFEYGYIVDVSWFPPTVVPVIDPLNDFPTQANSIEAYQVNINIDNTNLTNGAGSEAPVTVDVYDWQGVSTISAVLMESPELFTGTVSLVNSGTNPDGSIRYIGNLINEIGADLGFYPILAKVADTESDPNLGDVYAYQVYDLEIAYVATSPPVAIAKADTYLAPINEPVHFSDDGSFDPDGGSIVKYEWDWNNDGTFEETGSTADHTWATEGTYLVQFKVTDDESQTDTLDSPLEIVIEGELGDLTGIVKNGFTLEPIDGVSVVTESGGHQENITGTDGIFNLTNLPPGITPVDFSAIGYIPVSAEFDVVGGDVTNVGVVLMTPEGTDPGDLTGKIIDAITGYGIDMATVEIRAGHNNTSGAPLLTTSSNPSGDYFFYDVDPGTYTIKALKDGYNSNYTNGAVVSNETMVYDVTLSPILADGEIRIILTWAENPVDLDSHLKLIVDDVLWHVYFVDMGSLTEMPYAQLDVDDVTSYGPETTTISQIFPTRYKFFVHHWAGSGSISTTSNAVVKVYNQYGQIAEYHAPNTGEPGLWWEVFDYDGTTGVITDIDLIRTYEPEL